MRKAHGNTAEYQSVPATAYTDHISKSGDSDIEGHLWGFFSANFAIYCLNCSI